MYPTLKIGELEIDLYTVCLCAGVLVAVMLFRFFSDKREIKWRLQRFCILITSGAVIVGYGSAVLFQALYNIRESGKFEITKETGATFYGGLIGGAAFFLLSYFLIGQFMFKKDKLHLKNFFVVTDIAATSVAIAHSIGRIGCLLAPCCYGKVTDAWYGIQMGGQKRVPTQLYEAIFLLVLFGLFAYRVLKKKSYNLPLYMVLYGIWRFVIEFFRDDDRGETFVTFITPSQLIAVLMVVGSVALFFVQRSLMKKMTEQEHAEKEILPNEDVQESIAEESTDAEK